MDLIFFACFSYFYWTINMVEQLLVWSLVKICVAFVGSNMLWWQLCCWFVVQWLLHGYVIPYQNLDLVFFLPQTLTLSYLIWVKKFKDNQSIWWEKLCMNINFGCLKIYIYTMQKFLSDLSFHSGLWGHVILNRKW